MFLNKGKKSAIKYYGDQKTTDKKRMNFLLNFNINGKEKYLEDVTDFLFLQKGLLRVFCKVLKYTERNHSRFSQNFTVKENFRYLFSKI